MADVTTALLTIEQAICRKQLDDKQRKHLHRLLRMAVFNAWHAAKDARASSLYTSLFHIEQAKVFDVGHDPEPVREGRTMRQEHGLGAAELGPVVKRRAA